MKFGGTSFYNGWGYNTWSYIQKNRWYTAYLAIIIAVLLYGALSTPTPIPYSFTTEELNAKSELEDEIKMLESIPGAVYKPVTSSFKDHKIRYEYIYFNSQLDFEEVCNHYDKQLKSHGWKKLDGWNGRLWGNDNLIQYNKGEYWAKIEKYPDKRHQYSLEFNWHKHS
jgi:hypothetical protein